MVAPKLTAGGSLFISPAAAHQLLSADGEAWVPLSKHVRRSPSGGITDTAKRSIFMKDSGRIWYHGIEVHAMKRHDRIVGFDRGRRAGRRVITADSARGRQLFETLSCVQCHSVNGKGGIGRARSGAHGGPRIHSRDSCRDHVESRAGDVGGDAGTKVSAPAN